MIDNVTIDVPQQSVVVTEAVADSIVIIEAPPDGVVVVEAAPDSISVSDVADSITISEIAADTVTIVEATPDSVVIRETTGNGTGGDFSEVDPVFTNHAAHAITSQLIQNWTNAYNWGNHAGLYARLDWSYHDPDFIYSLAWGKIFGAPAFVQASDLNNYYTKTQLQTSGSGAQVHWDNLTNVPALTVDLSAYYTKVESDGRYIWNQNTVAQQASLWIDGSGQFASVSAILSSPSGTAGTMRKTQTTPNASDMGDGAYSLSYILQATSSTNQLVTRTFQLNNTNNLTGGGMIQNQRVFNLASNAYAGSRTTELDAVYIEVGNAAGVVDNYRGVLLRTYMGTSVGGFVADTISSTPTNATYLLLGTRNIPTGRWGIYQSTTDSNYFGGDVYLSKLTGTGNRIVYADTYGRLLSGSITDLGGTPSTGGTGYIQNQNTAAQVGANFWISGMGKISSNYAYLSIEGVTGGEAQTLYKVDNSTYFGVGINSGKFEIFDYANNARRFTILTNGNVGINNTNPQYTLDVNGSGRFSGGLFVNPANDYGVGYWKNVINGNTILEMNNFAMVSNVGTWNFSVGSDGFSIQEGSHSLPIITDAIQAYGIVGRNSGQLILSHWYTNNNGAVDGTMYYYNTNTSTDALTRTGAADGQFRGKRQGVWKNFLMEGDVASVSAPVNQILYGTGSGVISNAGLTYDGTQLNVNSGFITLRPTTGGKTFGIGSYASDSSFRISDTNNFLLTIDSTGKLLVGYTASQGNYTLQVNGDAYTNGAITTAQPSVLGAAPWKLGNKVNSGTQKLDTTGFVEVSIGGTTYRLALAMDV